MTLKFLYDPREAEGHPGEVFLTSLVYTLIGVALAILISVKHATMMMVFLATIALIPLFYRVITLEASKTEKINEELTLIEKHGKAVEFLVFLFLGQVIGFLFAYIVVPNSQIIFQGQLDTINSINLATGSFMSVVQNANAIFMKNINVLILTIGLSIVMGVGAILILSWNASVISAAIGVFINNISGTKLHSIPLGLSRYLVHGLLEMVAYFLGALAGSILYMEIMKHRMDSKHKRRVKHIIVDVATLCVLAVVVLYIAAVIELQINYLF